MCFGGSGLGGGELAFWIKGKAVISVAEGRDCRSWGSWVGRAFVVGSLGRRKGRRALRERGRILLGGGFVRLIACHDGRWLGRIIEVFSLSLPMPYRDIRDTIFSTHILAQRLLVVRMSDQRQPTKGLGHSHPIRELDQRQTLSTSRCRIV